MLPNIRRIACLVLFFWAWMPLQAMTPAVQGVMDLKDWTGPAIRLKGEWRFYPNQLLRPQDVLQDWGQDDGSAQWVNVGQSFKESGMPNNFGFGSYVLQLKNIPDLKGLAFNKIEAYTAFRVFVFDHSTGHDAPVLNAGQVSRDGAGAEPIIGSIEVVDVPDAIGSEAFILIQVSNHHHQWGGLWLPPQLGNRSKLLAEYAGEVKRNYLVIGALIVMGIYNFGLYSRRREDKGSLVLGLLSMVLIFRSLGYMGQSEPLLGNLVINFNLTLKFIYLSMLVAPILIMGFILDYFPRQMPRRVFRVCSWIPVPLLLFILFTDSIHFSGISIIGQYIAITMGALAMYFLTRALIARESGAIQSSLGGFSVFIGAIMDMATASGVYLFPENCIGYGLVLFTLAQSQIIGVRFAEAFRKAHHLGQALQVEVDRQTREIKTIMQSIELGIFTVVDEDLHIGDQYSNQLRKMTHEEQIHGRPIQDILFRAADISDDAKDQALSALSSAMNSDVMNYEMNSHCLPRQVNIQSDGTAAAQVWEIDWTPIVNSKNLVEKILICIRDVTDILKLKEKARDQESHLAIINELINVAEDRFSRFLTASQNLIQQNQTLLEAHPDAPNAAVLRALFMNMHTLKGMARTYQFLPLSAAAHEAEQCYARVQNNPSAWPIEQMKSDLQLVSQTLEKYETMGRTRLGWNLGHRILRIDKSRLEGMVQDLHAIPLKELSPPLRETIASVENRLGSECYRPVHDIIHESFKGVDSLARNLSKLPPSVAIESNDLYFRDQGADLIHSVLTHIIRNILDHGLELPDERTALGKEAAGHINIQVTHELQDVLISIMDDGRGLNLGRIEAMGRERGFIPADAVWTDEQLAELIFHGDFSTAREVTDISGRGVGMAAVRSFLEEQNGSIELQFTAARSGDFRSFAFMLCIPDELCWFSQLTQISLPEAGVA